MWLSAEYLIGLLSVIQGLHLIYGLDIEANSDPCIANILSCDWYRQPFCIYKEKNLRMFNKIEDLNKACKQQAAYMRCIVRAAKFCEQTSPLPISKEMIKSRRFPAEICRSASPWQQVYLKEASCLNAHSKEAFVHCGGKIIGIDILNLKSTYETICKHRRAIIDCSAAELQGKCGYYAGNVWKKMLMFHSLTDYKCSDFTPEEMDEYTFSSTPDYDVTEAIFSVLETEGFDSKAAEESVDVNANFEVAKLYKPESQTSPTDSSISDEAYTILDFDHPFAKESIMPNEYSFTDSLDSDVEIQTTTEDILKFSVLPNYHYVHKNKTTFALYEDLEMGHVNYMGCGEADFFWVILSPLRSKYCTLTDLESEFSEALFKCTIRIDAPCSPELNDDDRNKKAEVFRHRYVITVLTPPNNQRSEDMAIMNAHYVKFHLSRSMDVPENKVNLWTTQENQANTEQTIVGRKGFSEWEEDHNDVLYQQSNGSGRESDKDTTNSASHLPADEYESWDYHPLEKEDIYFPEILSNNIIYIEDDEGDLISLHDQRSPIYSKSVYQPHSLFRPRTGTLPSWTNPQHNEETGQKVFFPDASQSSIFKERISEFLDESLDSKVEPDKRQYCSAEAPCDQNTKFVSGFKTKPSMHRLPQNIQTPDTFEKANQHQKISSIKLNLGIDLKTFLISRDVYDVTPSTEIEVPKSKESSQTERRKDEFIIEPSIYLSEQEKYNIRNKAHDSQYVNPDPCASEKSSPFFVNSKTDSMKPFKEYSIDAFTRPPYLYKHTDTTANSQDPLHMKSLDPKPSSQIESLCEGYLAERIGNVLKDLFEKAEKPMKRELLDKILTVLEKIKHLLSA